MDTGIRIPQYASAVAVEEVAVDFGTFISTSCGVVEDSAVAAA